jgi:hypothetical protein
MLLSGAIWDNLPELEVRYFRSHWGDVGRPRVDPDDPHLILIPRLGGAWRHEGRWLRPGTLAVVRRPRVHTKAGQASDPLGPWYFRMTIRGWEKVTGAHPEVAAVLQELIVVRALAR